MDFYLLHSMISVVHSPYIQMPLNLALPHNLTTKYENMDTVLNQVVLVHISFLNNTYMNICIYNSQVIFRSYIHLYKYDDENECHLNSPYSYIHIPSHTSPLLNMENIHYSNILHHKTKLIHQLTYKYPPIITPFRNTPAHP